VSVFESGFLVSYLSAVPSGGSMPSLVSNHMEKSFAKDLVSLKAIFEVLDDFLKSNKLDESEIFSLKFAVEEIFTNMVKYNPGRTDVTISLKREAKKVQIGFVDFEKSPFDITKSEGTNASLPIEQRKPGGLGIFLLRKLMDGVEYSHDGTRSKITLTKFVE
jgi:anti-sigma regulatory factor (Ser/Thr protein kinase)